MKTTMKTNIRTSIYLSLAAILWTAALAGPAAAAEKQVPFNGSLAGTSTISDTFPIATVSANLTGNATHLGRFTLSLPHEVNLADTPVSATGTFVFIAANGDQVSGTFTGLVDSAAPPVFHVTETATITGGTGRFAGATGGFTMLRSLNVDLTTSGSFSGTISFSGQ